MDVDFIVAIFVFLVFVVWGVSFYLMLFEESGDQFALSADLSREAVMDFIHADVYEAPVVYESSVPASPVVLRADDVWYHGERNSTRVIRDGNTLPCRISGDSLYWQADLSSGTNTFTIQTATVNSSPNCTGAFSISSYNFTVPRAFVKKRMVSSVKIDNMTNMSYDSFRDCAGLSNDFRITVARDSGDVSYGKSVPAGPVDIFSETAQKRIFETSETANITIAVW